MDLDDTILDIDDISKLLDFDASVGVSAPSTFVPPAAPAPPPLVTRRRPYKPVLGPNVYENEPVANAISSETVSERLREIQETKDAIAEASFTLYEDTIRSGSLFKRARVAARDSNAFVDEEVPAAPIVTLELPDTKPTSDIVPGVQKFVVGYRFGMLSEEDVIAQSVVEIKSDKAFEPKSTKIMENGVIDPRMGPSDTTKKDPCQTCGGYLLFDHSMGPASKTYACQGHFGHLNGNAVFQPTHIGIILSLVRCVCVNCGHLPSDPAKTQRIVDQVLECGPDGTPLNRLQRLRVLIKHVSKDKECHVCRASIRCAECKNEAVQCKLCKKEKEHRPEVVRGEATTFPYHLVWKKKKNVRDLERVDRQMAAFKMRHNITDNDYTLNPELARFLLLSLKPEHHILLCEQLPKGPFHPASYSSSALERVFGKQTDNRKQMEVSQDYYGFIQSLLPRVIPFLPTMDRNGRSDADGTESLHEQTQRLSSLVKQRNHINAIAATEATTVLRRLNDKRNRDADDAGVPRPPPITDDTDADKGNLLRYRRGMPWHARGQVVDQPNIALAYADYQLLYTLWMAPHMAKQWRSVNSKIKMPNSARDGATRTKDRPQAPTTLQDNKPGRFRGNLTGKRVDFSSRSVITSDPLLDIDQVAIPYSVAATLTVPEVLCSYNFERVLREAQARVDGTDEDIQKMPNMPQLYLWNADRSQKVDIMKLREAADPKDRKISDHPYARDLGATIDRPLRDNDLVCFNRAPSLHRGSFMAMRVVLTTNNTFAFNPIITPLYNADFDGDEMNVHDPQDLVTTGEIQVLMLPSANIVLSRNSAPHAGLMQDFLLGAWRLSAKDCFFNLDQAFAMLFNGEMTWRNPIDDDPHNDKKNCYYIAPRIDGISCLGCVVCLESCRNCKSVDERCVSCRNESCCNGSRFKNNQLRDPGQVWFPQPCVRSRCMGCAKCRVDDEHQMDTDSIKKPFKRVMVPCDGTGWIKVWSGKQLASFSLPTWLNSQTTRAPGDKDLNFHVEHKEEIDDLLTPEEASQARVDKVDSRRRDFKKKGEPVFIRKGEFLTGTFNKSTVGATTDGIIQQILSSTSAPSGEDSVGLFADRNRNAIRIFMRTLGRMGLFILDNIGFSIGPDDMMAPNERVKLTVQMALFGVQRDPVNTPVPIRLPDEKWKEFRARYRAYQLETDPVLHGYPRFDVVAHDRKAVRIADLERLGIKFKRNQPGVERVVAKLIQDHYKSEVAIAENKITSVEQTYDVVTRVDRLETRIQNAQKLVVQRATSTFILAMGYDNGQYVMYVAGTKGSDSNISSCGVAVAGQDFSGKRLTNQSIKSYNVTDDSKADSGDHLARPGANSLYHRLLFNRPHGYAGAEAGAFINNSYISGLTPTEMFFHAMAGREGLIDTASKTGESGYLQRKMIKAFEAMKRAADGTVRDDANRIVSMASAGHPFSQQFLRSIRFEPLELDDKKFQECGLLAPVADNVLIQLRSQNIAEANRLVVLESKLAFDTVRQVREMQDFNQEGPVLRVIGDLSAIIQDAMIDSGHADKATTGLLPYKMSVLGRWYLDVLFRKWTDSPDDPSNALAKWYFANTIDVQERADVPMTVEYAIERVQRWLDEDLAHYDYITKATVVMRMTAKQILLRHQLSVNALELVIQRFNRHLQMCRSAPGEPTGIEVSQSIGEPATQMTLKTFHTAGRGNALVYAGIPRLKEVADCTTIANMKCPIIKTRILPENSARDIIRTTNTDNLRLRLGIDAKTLADHRLKVFGDGGMSPAIGDYIRDTEMASAGLIEDMRLLNSKYAARANGKRSKAGKATADKSAITEATDHSLTVYNAKIHQATNNFIIGVTESVGTVTSLTLDNLFVDWSTGNIESAPKSLGVRALDDVCTEALFRGASSAQKSFYLFCRASPALLAMLARFEEVSIRRAHIEALRIGFIETLISVISDKNSVIVLPMFAQDEFIGLATIVPHRDAGTMAKIYSSIQLMRSNLPLCYNNVAVGRFPELTAYFADLLDRHVANTVVAPKDTIQDTIDMRGAVEIAPLIRDFRITTLGSIAYSNNTIEFSPLDQKPPGRRVNNTCLELVRPMLFESEEEAEYITDEHRFPISEDYGCVDPGCETKRGNEQLASGVEEDVLLKSFSHCSDTLCVGSMALVIRIKSSWIVETNFDIQILRESSCTVRVFDMTDRSPFSTIVIRLHTCALDTLRARQYGASNPALVPVIVQCESMMSENRARRTAAERAQQRAQRFEADRLGTQGDTTDPYYLEELRVERGYVENFDFSARVIGLVDRLGQEFERLNDMHDAARDGTERSQVFEKILFVRNALHESYSYCEDIGIDFRQTDVYKRLVGEESTASGGRAVPRAETTPPTNNEGAFQNSSSKYAEKRVRQTRGTVERIAERRRVFTPDLLRKISLACKSRGQDDVTVQGRTYITQEAADMLERNSAEDARQAKIRENHASRVRSTARRRKVFDPQLLKDIMRHFAAEHLPNPLADAPQQQLKAVTLEMMQEEHIRIRTEIEMYELMRVSTHLNSFVFTGERGAHIVEREDVNYDLYTPESGHNMVKRSMAFIDSRSFRSVLSYRGVDVRNTTTTSVRCVKDVLGIEAARNSVIIELWEVLASSVDSTTSNYCNFAHFADVQTMTGDLMPLSRFGIHAHVHDTLQIASNEEQSVQTSMAGIAARSIDDIVSPSSAMMLAPHKIGFGTASVHLIPDLSKMFESIAPNPYGEEFDRLFPLSKGIVIAQPLIVPQGARQPMQSVASFAASVLDNVDFMSQSARRPNNNNAQVSTTSANDDDDEAMLAQIQKIKINQDFLARMTENNGPAIDTGAPLSTSVRPTLVRTIADMAVPVTHGLSREADAIASSRQFVEHVTQSHPSVVPSVPNETAYHGLDDDDDDDDVVSTTKTRRVQSVFQMALERQRAIRNGYAPPPQQVPAVRAQPRVAAGIDVEKYDPHNPGYAPKSVVPAVVDTDRVVEAFIRDEYNPEAPDISAAASTTVLSTLNELQNLLGASNKLGSRRLDTRDFLSKSVF
jgi:DNA-directed RNA polymerase beta' subunit